MHVITVCATPVVAQTRANNPEKALIEVVALCARRLTINRGLKCFTLYHPT